MPSDFSPDLSSPEARRAHAADCGEERAYDQGYLLGESHARGVARADFPPFDDADFYMPLEHARDDLAARFDGRAVFGSPHVRRGYDDGFDAALAAAREEIGEAIAAREGLQAREDFEKVAELGREEGKDAATWHDIDSSAVARDYLRAIEDCDTFDLLPGADFSGQWADGDTPAAMIARAGACEDAYPNPEYETELLDCYCDAYSEALQQAVEKGAREYLAAIDPLNREIRYTVAGWPRVAVYVEDQPTPDSVAVVMVGDDATHLVAREDLQPCEDFCTECGQVDCRGDFRAEDGNAVVSTALGLGGAIVGLLAIAPLLAEIFDAYARVAAILP